MNRSETERGVMELPDERSVERFKFNGNAVDYFAIWIVNHLLTWLTLGIYSAWAKVRTLQYFYGSTELAGGHFQFTASPLRILRGRIIAVLLLVLYFVVESVQSTLAHIVFISLVGAFFLFLPVLTVFVLSFKLRYSEWRGISFSFNKNYREAYRVYLIPLLIVAIFLLSFALPFNSTEVEEYFGYTSPVYQNEEESYYDDSDEEIHDSDEPAINESEESDKKQSLPDTDSGYTDDDYESSNQEDDQFSDEEDNYINPYLMIPSALLGFLVVVLLPYFDFINMRFFSRNARLGQAHFHFVANLSDYYIIYAKWFFMSLTFAALWGIEIVYDSISRIGLWWGLIILTVLYIPATRSYFKSQRYNILLSKTTIDQKHQLHADTSFLALFWIMLSNSVVLILTLGLMRPWTQIRTARYLLGHSSIDVQGSLDEFVAAQEHETNAMAEEIADVFDIDILG